MNFLKSTLLVSCLTVAMTSALSAKTVTVSNGEEFKREGETISVPVSSKKAYAVSSEDKEVVSQCVDLNGDGIVDEVLFQVDLDAQASKTFKLAEKGEKPTPTENPMCYGRHVPEREDDFAWENDKVAFRMYGPSLEKKDGKASGIDPWCKRVSYPIINKWYKGKNYHKDHGEGADFYKVGPSRGCGGLGYLADGKMIASGNWVTSKVITTGPIRVMFELTYAPVKVGSSLVTETKTISLDAGSNLCKFTSKFSVSDAKTINIAVGVVKRGKGGELKGNSKSNWLTYREPAMKGGNGTISCGIILPNSENFLDKFKHGILTKSVKNGQTLTYYAGFGWSKFGFEDAKTWDKLVSNESSKIEKPLTVEIK